MLQRPQLCATTSKCPAYLTLPMLLPPWQAPSQANILPALSLPRPRASTARKHRRRSPVRQASRRLLEARRTSMRDTATRSRCLIGARPHIPERALQSATALVVPLPVSRTTTQSDTFARPASDSASCRVANRGFRAMRRIFSSLSRSAAAAGWLRPHKAV